MGLRLERLEDRTLLSLGGTAGYDGAGAVTPDQIPMEDVAGWLADHVTDPENYLVDDSGNVICVDPPADPLQRAPIEQVNEIGAAAYPLDETFLLHSNPGASKVVYLDFNAHAGDPAYDFDGDGASFSDAELTEIQMTWEQASEDFIPFELDVTTEDPGIEALQKTSANDQYYGVRVVISRFDGTSGGWAYLWSFDWNYDQPCYVDTNGVGVGHKTVGEVISHELGHTLGLYHDGTSTREYYSGHDGWAPIMGVGYYQELVQWSKGEYPDANNTEDDLATITTYWGFGYRADDHGSTTATASPFTILDDTVVSDEGIIERNTDVDYFTFATGAGVIDLNIDPFYRSPNLDILAQLYDADGNLIASSNPTDQLDAHLSADVAPGNYFLSVEGAGKGTLATGYSDYGSLGYYSINGTVIPKASVAGRYTFYNNSAFDGGLDHEVEVVITEAGTGTPDYFEIQNVTDHAVDTSGWVVAANNAQNYDINEVHDPLWSLPELLAPYEFRYRRDVVGDNIYWRTTADGWLMILDEEGAVIDFVVWGYSDEALDSFRVNVGDFENIRVDRAWSGPSVSSDFTPYDALQRTGNADRDEASDWTFDLEPTGGSQNAGLTFPFTESDSGLDDDAIAPDKVALLPGEPTTFANYTSYIRGLNGIMVDIVDPSGTLAASDFVFKAGNDYDPANWDPLAVPPNMNVRPGDGVDGSTRATFIFDDHAIENQWLEVTVLSTANTGLPEADVFYFGNAIAEVGNSSGNTSVDAWDILGTRNNPRPFFDPAPIDSNYDFNRDQRVDAVDTMIAGNNQTSPFTVLKVLNHPSTILITEAETGTPDGFTIRNASESTVDTTGWIVAANNAANYDVQAVHEPLWDFPVDWMTAGQSIYRGDTVDDNIYWRTADDGWLMILDDLGYAVDFVIWGYDEIDPATLSLTIEGFPEVRLRNAWSGAAVSSASASSYVLRRIGEVDHNSASDWTFDEPLAGGRSESSTLIQWLYEFGTEDEKDQPLRADGLLARAVDKLLAKR